MDGRRIAPGSAAAVALLVVLTLLATGCTGGEAPPAARLPDPTTSTDGGATSDWETAAPGTSGFDGGALRRLARDARRTGSTCLVVARDGVIVGEWNWQGVDATTPREVFSVTKSVTSTLVGLAVGEGDLALDDRAAAYLPAWRGTGSARVAVRHLLANDSGRDWSPASDYGRLLQATNRTAYAVGLDQQYPPGRVWAYNNAAIQTLDGVLAAATGTATADFAQEALFEPLGMADTQMTPDASGRSTNAFFGLSSTCRDLARFGQLFAQQGEWDGEQLLPDGWVEEAVGAPSQDLNAAYGLLWWLNRYGPLRGPFDAEDPQAPPGIRAVGRLAPGAPADLFAAQGLGGQVVLVDPGSRTVVVRLGTLPQQGRPEYGFADAARVVTEALRPAR